MFFPGRNEIRGAPSGAKTEDAGTASLVCDSPVASARAPLELCGCAGDCPVWFARFAARSACRARCGRVAGAGRAEAIRRRAGVSSRRSIVGTRRHTRAGTPTTDEWVYEVITRCQTGARTTLSDHTDSLPFAAEATCLLISASITRIFKKGENFLAITWHRVKLKNAGT